MITGRVSRDDRDNRTGNGGLVRVFAIRRETRSWWGLSSRVSAAAALCLSGLTGLTAAPAAAQQQTSTTALAWGRNVYGQLGNGTASEIWNEPNPTPAGVDLPAGTRVRAVAAGADHSLALTSDGRVFAWGYNSQASLGVDPEETPDGYRATPEAVPGLADVTAIGAGGWHSLAVRAGHVFAWGYNNSGQVGTGGMSNVYTPTEVPGLPADVTAVAGGANHSLALTSNGRVYTWGSNSNGQLGTGAGAIGHFAPTEVTGLPAGTRVTAITAGSYYSLAVMADGRVFAWGSNLNGQLGIGETGGSRSTPVEVTGLPHDAVAVAAGVGHSLAVMADGRVFAWGLNSYGQLGIGSHDNTDTPVQVTGIPPDVTAVASGYGHSLALTADGRVFAWGQNFAGQLGDGTAEDRDTPVEADLPEYTRVTAIASSSGGYHSLAVAVRSSSSTTMTAEPGHARPGDPVTLTATVTCAAGTPAGTVTFTDDGSIVGSAALGHDGTATVITRSLAEGEHTIVARYSGGPGCTPSDSEPVTVTITTTAAPPPQERTSTQLTVMPARQVLGGPVDLTARVTCPARTATGTVDFRADGASIGTAGLRHGAARLTITGLAEGQHSITAAYGGSQDCDGSQSAPVTVTIIPARAHAPTPPAHARPPVHARQRIPVTG